MKRMRLATILTVGLLCSACVNKQPMLVINNAPVETAKRGITADQVRSAIIKAGMQHGWKMQDSGPNTLTARVQSHEHFAVIEIPYNEHSYSILYKDSSPSFEYSNGKISHRYNRWVQILDEEIQKELSLL